jgi:glycosyltransferase involved in cell wall biosynthesis
MRVLLLPNSYPPVLGGLQTVAHMLAQHLAHRGHSVRVVTNRYPHSLLNHEVRDGVPVSRWLLLKPDLAHLRRGRPELFLASLYYYPNTNFRLTRLMKAFRPDVVNVHFPDAQISFVLHLRRRFEFRLVVSLHGHDIERFTGEEDMGVWRALHYDGRSLAKLLRVADVVTACSRHLLEKAIRLEPSVQAKGRAIYNGIDRQRFQDKSRHSHNRPYLLAVGRLTRVKGFDLLLEAFAQLGTAYRWLDLILVGEGEDRDVLFAQVRRLALEGRVHFFGRGSSEEVVQLLNGCLFVIVPSRMESLGIVALEALAAGKPVLATRVGGLGEVLAVICGSKCYSDQVGSDSSKRVSREGEVPVMLLEASVDGLLRGMREWLSTGRAGSKALAADTLALDDYTWARVAERYERVLAGFVDDR